MKTTPRKVTRNEQVNLIDLFYYLIGNWYWFLLCILVALGIAFYHYSRMPFMYSSGVTAIIKNPGDDIRSARLETYDQMINKVSVTNEELQLRSLTIMTEVVKALNADVNYVERIKFRNVELYTSLSPVRMAFNREKDDPGSINVTVTPADASHIRLQTSAGSQLVALGDTVALGTGRVVFLPTARYTPENFGRDIQIQKIPVSWAANGFISRLHISHDKQIIQLVEQDYNAQRAADIINMLVIKYNEAAIREKNRVAIHTEDFINERLGIIEQELGGVEGELAGFKSANKLMSVSEAASMYLGDSRGFNTELVGVETQLALSNYLKDHVVKSGDSYQLIPSNMGLNDPGMDQVISQYNDLVLQRERLVAASSTGSPAVIKAESSLNTMRNSILGMIQNLQTSLDIQRRDLSERERSALQKFSTMPTKERQMLEIQRQQSIKQELYLFLLNKREENALSQAMADDNIRVIDPADPNYTPTSPQRMKIIMLAILIGLLIPAVILIARLFWTPRSARARRSRRTSTCRSSRRFRSTTRCAASSSSRANTNRARKTRRRSSMTRRRTPSSPRPCACSAPTSASSTRSASCRWSSPPPPTPLRPARPSSRPTWPPVWPTHRSGWSWSTPTCASAPCPACSTSSTRPRACRTTCMTST